MTTPKRELKNLNYEVFILAITLLSLADFFMVMLPISEVAKDVIYATDAILSIIFLGDFAYRLKTATNKTEYFIGQRGWIDLLSSLPFPQAKILRFFRLIRVFRILRTTGGKQIVREFAKNKGDSAIYIVVFLILLVLEFGSIVMLYNETKSAEASIQTAQEAMWYVFVTITTVGYGDYSPVTLTGRLTGIVVMVVGVGLFGVLTGFLANAFVPSKDDNDDIEKLTQEIRALREEIRKIKN